MPSRCVGSATAWPVWLGAGGLPGKYFFRVGNLDTIWDQELQANLSLATWGWYNPFSSKSLGMVSGLLGLPHYCPIKYRSFVCFNPFV